MQFDFFSRKKFKCVVCGKGFKSEAELQRSQKTRTPNEGPLTLEFKELLVIVINSNIHHYPSTSSDNNLPLTDPMSLNRWDS